MQSPDVRLVTEAAQAIKIKAETDPLKATDAAHDQRLDDLEVLGGLTPGDVNDATTASLIRNTSSETNSELNAAFVQGGLKGLFVDVTAPPYKAKGNGSADDYAAINQAAIDMETFGGGTVFIPKGVYRISAYLRPRNYVRYQGVGIGRTVIKPYQSAAFTGHGTALAPIESPEWFDMTWDGNAIAAGNSLKGQFSEHLRNAHWERVECTGFTATGFGSDFLPGGRYINCIGSYNGRGQIQGGPGMSGFGIGTGKLEVEDVLVQGCLAFGNTNYGIFVEKQGGAANAPYYSKGVRVIGNYSWGNAWGIGGCGVDSPVYSLNIVANNTLDGVILHEGSGAGGGDSALGVPDKRATITSNQIYGNGRDGILIDYGTHSIPANEARHIIDANDVHHNGRDGLRIVSAKWNSDVVRGIKIGAANRFDWNAGHGVAIMKAAGAEANVVIDDMHIAGFDANHNGGSGLYIGVSGIRWVIDSAKLYDDQVVKTQKFGIEIAASVVLTNAVIKDCDLLNNLTASTSWNLATNFAGYTIIDGNHGYYGGYAAVPLTASPVTYTAGFTKETFYFHGMPLEIKVKPRNAGEFITVGVTSTAPVNLVLTTLELDPGDSVEIAYTGSVSSVKSIRR